MGYRYTGLARVAREAGLKVVETYNWKEAGVDMGTIESVMVHHTAAKSYNKNAPSLNVVRYGRPGLPGPLCHYLIGRDGTVYVIAAGRGNHAGRVSKNAYTNSHSIGIEIENDGVGEAWSDELMAVVVKLTRALCDEWKVSGNAIDSFVVAHKEAAIPKGRKIDPTFDMNAFRKAVKAGSWKGGTPAPKPEETKPAATPKPSESKAWPDKQLGVRGSHTKASHAAWVKLLSDVGYKDKDLTKNFQRWLRDLDYYERAIDGDFGYYTVVALQEFLKHKGLYKGLIDGDRGEMTIKAEINFLNTQIEYYK